MSGKTQIVAKEFLGIAAQFSVRQLLLFVAIAALCCLIYRWAGLGGLIVFAIWSGIGRVARRKLETDESLAAFAVLAGLISLLSAPNFMLTLGMLCTLSLLAIALGRRGTRAVRCGISAALIVSIIPCGAAECCLAYNVGYWRGRKLAKQNLAAGLCQIATRALRSERYCIVNAPFDPAYDGYCGERAGFASAIPPGCGSYEFAEHALQRRGIRISPARGTGRHVAFPTDSLCNEDLESLVILQDVSEWDLSGQSRLDDGCLRYFEFAGLGRQVKWIDLTGTKISVGHVRQLSREAGPKNPIVILPVGGY